MSTETASAFPFEETYQRYLDGLLTNQRAQCRACFDAWLAADPDLRRLYDELMRRALYEVGELWETGKISVATEHLATAISEALLSLTYPRLFDHPRIGKTAIVSCISHEHHQIGGKMVADLFELHGWRGYFLGANKPVEDLTALIAEKQPDVVALSLATVMNLDRLIATAATVRAAFPTMPILVGGQAFRWIERAQVETLPDLRCLKSLSELEAWMEERSAA